MSDSSTEYHFPLVASWIVVGVLLIQEGAFAARLDPGETPTDALSSAALALANAALFGRWQWWTLRGADRHRARKLALALMVGSWFSLLVDHQWAALPLFFAALMVGERRRVFVPLLIGNVVGLSVAMRLLGSPELAFKLPSGVLAIGVVLYAFTRLSMVVRQLQRAREELARARVDDERLRIQRDLHDMLGRTLVAASMRNQVALRSVGRDDEATRDHLRQLHAIVSDGQARLRALTSGPTIVGLRDEVASARDLCGRLGVTLESAVDDVPDEETERFAAALIREAVTNMLKHSQARRCELAVRVTDDEVVVHVANDGRIGERTGTAGTGVAHLRDLAERLDGTLTAGPHSRDRFIVEARLPRPALPTAPERTEDQ